MVCTSHLRRLVCNCPTTTKILWLPGLRGLPWWTSSKKLVPHWACKMETKSRGEQEWGLSEQLKAVDGRLHLGWWEHMLSMVLKLYFFLHVTSFWGFPGNSVVKNLPAVHEPQEMQVRSLGQDDPLGEGISTHSSILPGESHGLRSPTGSIGSQRVRHNWSDWAHTSFWP